MGLKRLCGLRERGAAGMRRSARPQRRRAGRVQSTPAHRLQNWTTVGEEVKCACYNEQQPLAEGAPDEAGGDQHHLLAALLLGSLRHVAHTLQAADAQPEAAGQRRRRGSRHWPSGQLLGADRQRAETLQVSGQAGAARLAVDRLGAPEARPARGEDDAAAALERGTQRRHVPARHIARHELHARAGAQAAGVLCRVSHHRSHGRAGGFQSGDALAAGAPTGAHDHHGGRHTARNRVKGWVWRAALTESCAARGGRRPSWRRQTGGSRHAARCSGCISTDIGDDKSLGTPAHAARGLRPSWEPPSLTVGCGRMPCAHRWLIELQVYNARGSIGLRKYSQRR